MLKGGHIYILGSPSGTLYIGVTSGLYRRILQHRTGNRSGFAHKYGCTRLLYAEPYERIEEAIARETQLKGCTRAKKLALMSKLNPDFKDMAKRWWRSRRIPTKPRAPTTILHFSPKHLCSAWAAN